MSKPPEFETQGYAPGRPDGARRATFPLEANSKAGLGRSRIFNQFNRPSRQSESRRRRLQRVEGWKKSLPGELEAAIIYKNIPYFISQDYMHTLVGMPWKLLVLLIGLSSFAFVGAFAILFKSADPDNNTNHHAYILSIQTWTTIGYGVTFPQTDTEQFVAMLCTFVSFMFTSVCTGIAFIKFSLPHAGIVWADSVCVHRHNNKTCLFVRLAVIRDREDLVDGDLQIVALRPKMSPEGILMLAPEELRLQNPRPLSLGHAFTFIHEIDVNGPLRSFLPGLDLGGKPGRSIRGSADDLILVARFIGYSLNFHSDVASIKTYHHSDIQVNRRFADMIDVKLPGPQFTRAGAAPGSHAAPRSSSPPADGSQSRPAPARTTYIVELPRLHETVPVEGKLACLERRDTERCEDKKQGRYASDPGATRQSALPDSSPSLSRTHEPCRSKLFSISGVLGRGGAEQERVSEQLEATEAKQFSRDEWPTLMLPAEGSSQTEYGSCWCNCMRNMEWSRCEPQFGGDVILKGRPWYFGWDKPRFWYFKLTESTWPQLLTALFVVYVFVLVVFAVLMYADGDTLPESRQRSREAGADFLPYLWWSVHTLSTVGYGVLHPNNAYGHVLVTVEGILSMVLLTVLAGVVWSKFASSPARIMFSNNAVVARYDGVPHIMARCCSLWKGHLMLSGRIRMSAILLTTDPVTGLQLYREIPLRLTRPHPVFPLTATFMHRIGPDSPLYGLLEGTRKPEAKERQMRETTERVLGIRVLVEAFDGPNQRIVVSKAEYDIPTHQAVLHNGSHSVVFGHRLSDIILLDPRTGRIVIDYGRFHNIECLGGTMVDLFARPIGPLPRTRKGVSTSNAKAEQLQQRALALSAPEIRRSMTFSSHTRLPDVDGPDLKRGQSTDAQDRRAPTDTL